MKYWFGSNGASARREANGRRKLKWACAALSGREVRAVGKGAKRVKRAKKLREVAESRRQDKRKRKTYR